MAFPDLDLLGQPNHLMCNQHRSCSNTVKKARAHRCTVVAKVTKQHSAVPGNEYMAGQCILQATTCLPASAAIGHCPQALAVIGCSVQRQLDVQVRFQVSAGICGPLPKALLVDHQASRRAAHFTIKVNLV